jgi:hypothetical protein
VRTSAQISVLAFCWAAAQPASAYEPAVNYQLHCMGCHLADGSGLAGRVPSLRRSLVLFSGSAAGRDYVVRVPGVAQSPLSDEDTALLLNWMAKNLSDVKQPSGFVDYSGAEIHGLRDRPLVRVSAERARLWQAQHKSR